MTDKCCDNGSIIWGIILLVVGALLLLGNVYGFNAWTLLATYWPLIPLGIGGWLILKEILRKK